MHAGLAENVHDFDHLVRLDACDVGNFLDARQTAGQLALWTPLGQTAEETWGDPLLLGAQGMVKVVGVPVQGVGHAADISEVF